MSESKKLVDIFAREMSEWPENDGGHGYCLHCDEFAEVIFGGFAKSLKISAMADDYKTARVTRAEWQDARDALLATEAAKVWSGEGIPGAGQSCNIRFTDHLGSSPHPVTILSFGDRKVFYRDAQGDEFLHDREYVAYSPILTPEQIKAYEREQAIKDLYFTINWADDPDIWPRISDARKADYARAIDAGYAKVDQ